MKRASVVGVLSLALLMVVGWWWLSTQSSSGERSQYIELVADPPIDLEIREQREFVTLVMQKLSVFGRVRSALRSNIPIPDFVEAGPQTTLLLAQRQSGVWSDVAGRQELVRLMAQIRGRLGGAQVTSALLSQLPFPNPVPSAIKKGRCWRVKASTAQSLKAALTKLKDELGERLWTVDDLPQEKAFEALALRMELETKEGAAAMVFSASDIESLDVAAARLRVQAIDCGRNGMVDVLPFVIEEFHHARFTQLDAKGWLSAQGDRLLLKVDLPEGVAAPNWGKIVAGFPGISVHQTGDGGRVQLTPATILHDQFEFRVPPQDRDPWISAQGHVLLTVEPRPTEEQLQSIRLPAGWSLKLTRSSRARP